MIQLYNIIILFRAICCSIYRSICSSGWTRPPMVTWPTGAS